MTNSDGCAAYEKKEGDERMYQNKVAQRLLSQSVSQSVSQSSYLSSKLFIRMAAKDAIGP